MVSVYPARDRTGWIVAQRPGRAAPPDPLRPQGFFLEEEPLASGEMARSGVVLLTNKECPWHCLMCDLWKDTTAETVPLGAIPHQVGVAVDTWRAAGPLPAQVKLYNSGSFFDSAAIPPGDYERIAQAVDFAENVVVESHPRLVGERTWRWRDLIRGSLEVAIGLETAHAEVLEKLNKQFDAAEFSRATDRLRAHGVALRVFLLVHPPFLFGAEALDWIVRSAEFSYACGASAVSLIPTRRGNGAMERLAAAGEFAPPTLGEFEQAVSAVRSLGRGRVFADAWGLEPFATCPHCRDARIGRLRAENLSQRGEPPVRCAACGGS